MKTMISRLTPPGGVRTIAAWAFAASVAFVLGTATVYAIAARPTADDFCRASLSSAPGAWLTYVGAMYNAWSGRWLAHALYGLTFPHLDITSALYPLLVNASLILWAGIFYMFVGIACGRAMPARQRLPVAIAMTALFWTTMPGVGEVWYWLTGIVEYTTPVALSLASLYLISHPGVVNAAAPVRFASFAVAGLLIVAVTGMNELVGLVLLGALSCALAIAMLQQRRGYAAGVMALIAVAMVGLGVNLLAPGTALRTARDFPDARNLGKAIVLAFLRPDQSPLKWVADARIVLFSLLLAITPTFAGLRPPWTSLRTPLLGWSIVVPAVAVAAIYASLFVVSYAEGKELPPRLMAVLFALFIMSWFVCVFHFRAWLAPAGAGAEEMRARLLPVVMALASASLAFGPNTVTALMDLRHVVPTWAHAVDARDPMIRGAIASGASDIALQPVDATPSLFFWRELSSDPRDWRNQCYAKYYRARTIRALAPGLKADADPSPPPGP